MDSHRLTVYGASWCHDTQNTRARLDDLKVPYEYHDVDVSEDAKRRVEEANHGGQTIPVLDFPDGHVLIEPDDQELEAALQAHGAQS
jgi:glutaredoxin